MSKKYLANKKDIYNVNIPVIQYTVHKARFMLLFIHPSASFLN